ncbi:MAG: mannitol dehydrogenase family protein [Roseibium sp.]|uniref:mannitol dehydrogenase family protein n=1 Tax=Roseibium sp. TaxID=1936156 RepID=UPI00263935E9|nr:mannitol dehydrogenase family protein [Roseibium sp.]MCV0427707.1 mannitol dehydrogenase family protein [Roseibium sp.]
MTTTPIVQFGTSRFLQAHVDLFVSEALNEGRALGSVAVVQSSGDPSRSKRAQALAAPEGYEVQIKGIDQGKLVNTSKRVTSITRGYSLPENLSEVTDLIASDAEIILSNTADAGFRPQMADRSPDFRAEMSYPAKLTWFLNQRFKAGGGRLQIMPTELVPQNGDFLRDLVRSIAEIYGDTFLSWLDTNVLWVSSLVDRIVSEPLEPAGAVAEPYALWAIEDRPGLILPCEHAAVHVVGDLEQVETLKLFILNLGHTYLVSRWMSGSDPFSQYVREFLEHPDNLSDLQSLYASEVVPAFAAHGRKAEAEAYVATTIDRFRNPFLDHKLSDIAQNHAEKIQRRIAAFLKWAWVADPALQMPRLESVSNFRSEASA